MSARALSLGACPHHCQPPRNYPCIVPEKSIVGRQATVMYGMALNLGGNAIFFPRPTRRERFAVRNSGAKIAGWGRGRPVADALLAGEYMTRRHRGWCSAIPGRISAACMSGRRHRLCAGPRPGDFERPSPTLFRGCEARTVLSEEMEINQGILITPPKQTQRTCDLEARGRVDVFQETGSTPVRCRSGCCIP